MNKIWILNKYCQVFGYGRYGPLKNVSLGSQKKKILILIITVQGSIVEERSGNTVLQ